VGTTLWSRSATFGSLLEGLGAELPASTKFVVAHGGWLYPLVFGGLIGVLTAKELLVQDKRLSAMLTVLVTIVAQFLSQWLLTPYFLPLFGLMDKLS
jgi:uncharacterized membrane protein YeaQ/YmgE (transglycosylase-associated protein family)